MSNEQEVVVDPNNDEKVVETSSETGEVTAEGTQVEKPKRTPEEELAYFEGRARRLRKDLGLDEPGSKSTKKSAQKSDEPDYAKLSYLETKGVVESDDQEWLIDLAKESKTELRDLLKKSWVQLELKERKELKDSSNAMPKGPKRTNNSSQDTVDYWLAKGEMPPKENTKLRREYVNAKMEREKDKGKFYNS